MIVAFTGHRPNKLGGYKTPNPTSRYVTWRIELELIGLNPDRAISGMALGVDQWASQVCVKLGIPFVAAVPFKGQESQWPEQSQREFQRLIKLAEEVVVVCDGGYSAAKMQRRNEYMVDKCDILIAVWDGTPGGTGNCVRYAQSKGKEIIRILPC
jgi:uncharacterized phage-like protein YoqJ